MKIFIGAVLAVLSNSVQAAERGIASTYWEDREVACPGERFNPRALAAAHRTHPCGAKVRVTNQINHKSVVVRINDLGPCSSHRCRTTAPMRVRTRIIDLTPAAAKAIGSNGLALVDVELLSEKVVHADLDGVKIQVSAW